MFGLFKDVPPEDNIQQILVEIQQLFSKNQLLLNCLKQLKHLNEQDTNHPNKLALVESFAFNTVTSETLMNYNLETIDKLIHEILNHQNQISLQHHAFLHLKEHMQIAEHQTQLINSF